jgi:hypothetical protein
MQSVARHVQASQETNQKEVKVMAKRKSQEDTDNDYRSVKAMGERLGLKGEGLANYIHKHMTTLGHKPQTRYTPGDGDDKDDGDDGSFF